MITVEPGDRGVLRWAQQLVTARHYLRRPVDDRCAPLAYTVTLDEAPIGCLIVGRPEATRCFDGALTYGSRQDVQAGRAAYDRWEILNLARVYLLPAVQAGGEFYRPELLPGYVDRRGTWRSTLASTVLGLLLARVGFDYLSRRPPCFLDEPYQIRVLLSYCDTRLHRGTIYRAAGFALARSNRQGIETYVTTAVAPLSADQDRAIQKLAQQSTRSQHHRRRRWPVDAVQECFL